MHQTTAPEFLPEWLGTGTRTLYCGFDPTADSLHVGSLLPVMMLRRYQRQAIAQLPWLVVQPE
ncbi:MAG: hypothetical protein U0894_17070 [Pirellulales bacterium]